MSARNDVWMPLYVADYLRDTQHLSTVEHGAYFLLIMHAWSNGGAIPRNDEQLSRITRLTLAQWRKIKATVTSFWTDHGEVGQIYMHDRILKEISRAEAIVEKRRKAGVRGAASRWQNDSKCHADDDTLPVASGLQTDGQSQSQSHNPPSEVKRARKLALPDGCLENIWGDAPPRARQRSSQADVRKSLTAAISRGGDPDQIRSALRAYWSSPDATKDGGEYAKAIHRMIEGDRWKDWLGESQSAKPDEITRDDWIRRVGMFRKDGMWLGSWGPRPGERGCICPPDLLEG